MPRVRHLTGGALFPCRPFLVAGHLSCDASCIGAIRRDFRRISCPQSKTRLLLDRRVFTQIAESKLLRGSTQHHFL